MSPSAWVPLLVVGILAVQVVIWIFVAGVIRRQNAALLVVASKLVADRVAAGEESLFGPILCRVRHGHVSSRATVALTDQRLIFHANATQDLPLDTVRSVRVETWFNGNARAGFRWVIVKLDEREVGFAAAGTAAESWSKAIQRAAKLDVAAA